ncbi:hypothetical protein DIPPA_16456 [Diplonema papillatum]|nr:hypothetical protein DIPPA_16456 [Diplonema papillatum]
MDEVHRDSVTGKSYAMKKAMRRLQRRATAEYRDSATAKTHAIKSALRHLKMDEVQRRATAEYRDSSRTL